MASLSHVYFLRHSVFEALREIYETSSVCWAGSFGIPVHVLGEPKPKTKSSSRLSRSKNGRVPSTSSKDNEITNAPVLQLPPFPTRCSIPPDIDYVPGILPVVISAPHAGNREVPGCPSRRGIYGNDEYIKPVIGVDGGTAKISLIVQDLVSRRIGGPIHLLRTRFHRRYADCNRGPLGDDGSPYSDRGSGYETEEQFAQWNGYHSLLEKVLRMHVSYHGRCFLLDIHSNGRQSEGKSGLPIKDCLTRGTRRGASVSDLVSEFGDSCITGEDSLFGQLALRGYSVEPPLSESIDSEETYQGGYITEHYGKISGVTAMQIEVGSGYRQQNDEITQRTGEDIAESLSHFLETYFLRGLCGVSSKN